MSRAGPAGRKRRFFVEFVTFAIVRFITAVPNITQANHFTNAGQQTKRKYADLTADHICV